MRFHQKPWPCGLETALRKQVSNDLLIQRSFDDENEIMNDLYGKSLKSECLMYYNSSKRHSVGVYSITRDTVLILKKSEKAWMRGNINK